MHLFDVMGVSLEFPIHRIAKMDVCRLLETCGTLIEWGFTHLHYLQITRVGYFSLKWTRTTSSSLRGIFLELNSVNRIFEGYIYYPFWGTCLRVPSWDIDVEKNTRHHLTYNLCITRRLLYCCGLEGKNLTYTCFWKWLLRCKVARFSAIGQI